MLQSRMSVAPVAWWVRGIVLSSRKSCTKGRRLFFLMWVRVVHVWWHGLSMNMNFPCTMPTAQALFAISCFLVVLAISFVGEDQHVTDFWWELQLHVANVEFRNRVCLCKICTFLWMCQLGWSCAWISSVFGVQVFLLIIRGVGELGLFFERNQ